MTTEEELIILKRLEKLEQGISRIETISMRLPAFQSREKKRRIKGVKKNY